MSSLSSDFQCKPGGTNEAAITNAGAAILLTKAAAVDEFNWAIRETLEAKGVNEQQH